MTLDQLTTQADSYFRDLQQEGKIDADSDQIKAFFDTLVNFLESQGGRVGEMKYK